MTDKKEKIILEKRKKWANSFMVRKYRNYLLRYGDPEARVYLDIEGTF